LGFSQVLTGFTFD